MKHLSKIILSTLAMNYMLVVSCQDSAEKPITENKNVAATAEQTKQKEPHRYGGWYCPDNFGFTPVNVAELSQVPAISDRLPSEEELQAKMSLIKVDLEKYPEAKALPMKLPRLAKVYSDALGMDELAVVIQAITVQEDTVVGYRFVNGGNGSAWLSDVKFLSDEEVSAYGSQPFFYRKESIKASKEQIWKAFIQTSYAEKLGAKFEQQEFFSQDWSDEAHARLRFEGEGEKAKGYCALVYGVPYLHIDYNQDGFHYSEKMLLLENEDGSTDLHFASGPFPQDFAQKEREWNDWFSTIKENAEKL